MRTTRINVKKKYLLIGLIISMTLFMLPKPILATPNGYEQVVIAWDEEFDATEYYEMFWWGFEDVPIPTTRMYVEWQWSRAMYWWNLNFGEYIQFEIAYWTTWDSDDSLYIDEMLLEAEQETGFADGAFGNSILIALTGQIQPDDNILGGCLPENRSIIIRNDRWHREVIFDNVLMHEISHLWYEGHSTGECVMSYEEVYIEWYDEPLAPQSGHLTFLIMRNGLWSHFSYIWSDNPVKTDMIDAMLNDYPPPPDPWLIEPDPPKRDLLLCYVIAAIGTIIGVSCLVYFILRKLKVKPKIVKDQQSSIRLMTMPYLTMITFDFLIKSVIGFYTFILKDSYTDLIAFLNSSKCHTRESRDYEQKSLTHMYERRHPYVRRK